MSKCTSILRKNGSAESSGESFTQVARAIVTATQTRLTKMRMNLRMTHFKQEIQ
jgi:hypothetical protein